VFKRRIIIERVLHTAALSHAGPLLIIAGLAALILVAAFPTVPAITAFSILTLGATNATLARLRNSPAIAAALLLHSATYASLYAQFIGATLHAAASTPPGVLAALPALDLAASIVPMAISLRRIAAALGQQFEPQ
jgi:hypothetical protein